MSRTLQARAAGAMPAGSDEEPTVAAVVPQESTQDESPDSHGAAHVRQALRVIDGERKAADYLARLHAQQADPDEMALVVSMLYGATLRGFCRLVEKAQRGRHA